MPPALGLLDADQPGCAFGAQNAGLDGFLVLRTSEGAIQRLEKRIAFLSPVLQLSYDPATPDEYIELPEVSAQALSRVIEYCRFHLAPGHSRPALDWAIGEPDLGIVHVVHSNLLAEFADILAEDNGKGEYKQLS